MSTPLPAGVIFVDDVKKVARFYMGVAQMQQLHADDDHIVLEANDFQLTVHALRPGTPISSDYPTREYAYIKLCFAVDDISLARSVAADLGGEVWPPQQEWQARGFRACDGRDPEGNVFQLRQATA